MFKSYLSKNHQMNIPSEDAFLKGIKIVQAPAVNTPESDHFNERINKETGKPIAIDQLVIHCSFEPNIEKVIQEKNNVGAHYVVHCDGTIFQCIDESKRAYHAGGSSWEKVHGGADNINAHSIGIEVENPTFGSGTDYTKEQIESLIKLCKSIMARHHIKPENVIGHSDIAPTRKADPGVLFPWRKLAQAGIGIYPKLTELPPKSFEKDPQKLLASIGYNISDFPAAFRAFKRHFMPFKVQGEAPSTQEITKARQKNPHQSMNKILKDLHQNFMMEYEKNVQKHLPEQPKPTSAEIKRLQVVAHAFEQARNKNR